MFKPMRQGCPHEYHKVVEAVDVVTNLIGYQLLPGRDGNDEANYLAPSDAAKVQYWTVNRLKFGGRYRKAPVMIDKIQAAGSIRPPSYACTVSFGPCESALFRRLPPRCMDWGGPSQPYLSWLGRSTI